MGTCRVVVVVLSAAFLTGSFACADRGATAAAEEANAPPADAPSTDAGLAAAHHHEGAPSTGTSGDDASAPPPGPPVVLGPSCDEDNPVTGTTEGTIDRALPDAIVQYERSLKWGCLHREYHETRLWDYLTSIAANADRYAYVQKMGWQRAAIQEGAPGSGLDFLAMHRAMLGTLRDRFPQHAALFEGWSTIPTQATSADPLPPAADGGAPPAFWDSMKTAIARLETDLGSFASEDDLGRYIETQHRPTATDPFARSTETGSGLHTYIHVRFDDPRSPIRMQRFSRNVESEVFFRLHGWVDRIWSEWRESHGLVDETDAAYADAMHHACMHMGLMHWDVARAACTE